MSVHHLFNHVLGQITDKLTWLHGDSVEAVYIADTKETCETCHTNVTEVR